MAHSHSEEIQPGYWLGTNFSRAHVAQIIRLACDIARLEFGKDLIVNLGE